MRLLRKDALSMKLMRKPVLSINICRESLYVINVARVMKKIIWPKGPAKKIILLRFCPEKKFSARTKIPSPPPPLNIKWTVPYRIIGNFPKSCRRNTRKTDKVYNFLESVKFFFCFLFSFVLSCEAHSNAHPGFQCRVPSVFISISQVRVYMYITLLYVHYHRYI